jgi:hypothetical protein
MPSVPTVVAIGILLLLLLLFVYHIYAWFLQLRACKQTMYTQCCTSSGVTFHSTHVISHVECFVLLHEYYSTNVRCVQFDWLCVVPSCHDIPVRCFRTVWMILRFFHLPFLLLVLLLFLNFRFQMCCICVIRFFYFRIFSVFSHIFAFWICNIY